jgi:hypothetical protein
MLTLESQSSRKGGWLTVSNALKTRLQKGRYGSVCSPGDEVSKQRTRSSTRQRTELETRVQEAQLTDLEEQVIRMRHGVVLQPEQQLAQRTMPLEETRLRVAAIEHCAVEQLLNSNDMRRKQRIIEHLRDI